MKLKQHREDIRFLRRLCDYKLPEIANRYSRLVLWAESVIDEVHPDLAKMERREKRVVKDAEGKS